jgi:uncharacterized protein (UPF0276 family)
MLPAFGYAIRDQNRYILDEPALNAVEITFERANNQPLRVDRYIGEREFDYVSVHALKMSVASPEPPSRTYLAGIRAVAEENGASSISDHLGFTRDGDHGADMGHFAAPPFTAEALDATCRNIESIQRYFHSLPFFIENIAYLFRFRGGTMSEAEFLIQVLEKTGCGWLLDVTNVYANAWNFGHDAREFIRQVMPSAPRLEMHLAGGFLDETSQMYIDSHSRPITEDVWDLYRYALEQGRGKVDAVFIERDNDFPDEAGWRDEIRRSRRVAEEVEAQP